MWNRLAISAAALGMTSCGPNTQVVELGRCWSTSVGERISGSALLYAFDGDCIECGSFLAASDKCPAITFSIGSEQSDRTYRRLRRLRANDMGMISQPVSFSGVTVPSGGKRGMMIRLDRLDLDNGRGAERDADVVTRPVFGH